jgi:hypothetical protein
MHTQVLAFIRWQYGQKVVGLVQILDHQRVRRSTSAKPYRGG